MARKKKNGTETIKGGEIVARMLAAEGVEVVFGIIDGTYFGFYSRLEKHGIRLITPRHETCAAHMAGAYARATGKLGVCIASNGPGVANMLSGVAVENAEGNRVLLVTSCRREGIGYPDRGGTFQYFDQVGVTGGMTKWACVAPTVDRVAEITRKALRKSWAGRPGVVHVDIPESVMNCDVEADPGWFLAPSQYRQVEPVEPTDAQVAEAARLLVEAKLPLIQAGSGVIHALSFEELHALAEATQAAVTTSWGARACVDERRHYVVPLPYVETVDLARNEADLVLVLGSRLGETDWWGKAPNWARPDAQRMIQVDIDPDTIGNNRPLALAVQADVKAFLRKLVAYLEQNRPRMDLASRRAQLNKLRERVNLRREELDQRLCDDRVPMVSPRVIEACDAVFDDDAIMVIDGGNTAIFGNFYHEVRAYNTVITTPKMGHLGAGVAQPLGAQVAFPDRQVFCVIGDGAMGFQMQEIETAVRNGLPVVYLVLCDRQWGMVKMNQQFALKPLKTFLLKSLPPEETINADLGEIQWDRVAQAMGAYGERVADPRQLKGAIRRAIDFDGPAVIHVDVDPVEHMWAPNLKTFKEMHEEPEG